MLFEAQDTYNVCKTSTFVEKAMDSKDEEAITISQILPLQLQKEMSQEISKDMSQGIVQPQGMSIEMPQDTIQAQGMSQGTIQEGTDDSDIWSVESSKLEDTPYSLLRSVTLNTPKLSVILDLNGVLVDRCLFPSKVHHSMKCRNNYFIVLRHGCLEFLKTLLDRCNVGIWSTELEHNVIDIIRQMEKCAQRKLRFFVVWGQQACYTYNRKKINPPDKVGVEARFKPLARISRAYECDARRTILIDDSPYKASLSPPNNCIFPLTFDVNEEEDNTLMGELLPYLLKLEQEAIDVI